MNYEAFISYRRVDTEIARRIYETLAEQRHMVFFDVDSLLAGDFTAAIKVAIQDSELVVALLTCESIRRMADDPERDMVRKELETAKVYDRPIQFLWLQDSKGKSGSLYELLAEYAGDELLNWLAAQNIMAFTDEESEVRRICGKVLETLEDERRKKFDQLRGSSQPELHKRFSVGERQYVYHGNSRFGIDGKSFPYGEGTMVNESMSKSFLIYEGNWEGDESFSGHGTVYREKKDGTRTKIYQGHWHNLEYHDCEGRIFDEESGELIYEGYISHGKRNMADGVYFFHMELYDMGDTERKDPLYFGCVGGTDPTQPLDRSIYGEGRGDDGTRFRGWYERYKLFSGELDFTSGERYSGGVLEETGRNPDGRRQKFYRPNGFGRMIYPDGRIYEGEWNTGKWNGYGIAIYPGDGMEIKAEGYFRGSALSANKECEVKISIRRTGEKEFRQVYNSPAKGGYTPGAAVTGYGNWIFSDGSIYEGKLRDVRLMKGNLYASDDSEYVIDQDSGSKNQTLGVDDANQEAIDLILRCMDEIWETLHPMMSKTPESWYDFQNEIFKGISAAAVSKEFRRSMTDDSLPEYPYGAFLPNRALAMCGMPPSRLFMLPEEEFDRVRSWFARQGKMDMEALKNMVETWDAENEKTCSEQRVMSAVSMLDKLTKKAQDMQVR